MYEDRQNQSERIIYSWEFKSIYCDVVQSLSWYAWVSNLFVCKMAIRLSALFNKAKKNLDKIRQCINGKIRVRYGSKNQEQSIKKIGQRKFNSTVLARQIRQGSTSEVIN